MAPYALVLSERLIGWPDETTPGGAAAKFPAFRAELVSSWASDGCSATCRCRAADKLSFAINRLRTGQVCGLCMNDSKKVVVHCPGSFSTLHLGSTTAECMALQDPHVQTLVQVGPSQLVCVWA